MLSGNRRPILIFQTLLVLTTLAFTGVGSSGGGSSCCGSSCDGGSDHTKTSALGETSLLLQPGVIERWHDVEFAGSPLALNAKDLAYLRAWLPGNAIIGLQVPRAPGATAPGSVLNGEIRLWINRQGGSRIDAQVPLTSRDDLAARIAEVFPPAVGSQWQALVPTNNAYLGLIPTQATTFTGGNGYFYYQVDFHGAEVCNGCMIQCTVCTPAQLPPNLRLAGKLLPNGLRFQSANGLTCLDMVPTVIHITEGTPPPSQVTAWLSPWGGPVFSATFGPSVELSYALGHNLPARETFNLEPIHSAQGWPYAWRSLDGQPISQITLDPDPGGFAAWEENLKIVGTVPTCTLAVDTIHITATSTTSPALHARNTSFVNTQPDPATCPVFDLGISKLSSRSAITGGQSVSFTLTVTNYEQTAADAVVTDILAPASALGSVTLPPGCTRSGAQITCQMEALPPGVPRSLVIGVRVSPSFGGVLSNQALVSPARGTDSRLYDNYAGPVTVTVRAGGGAAFVPLLLKR